MRIELEGTQAEVTALLGAFGDAGLRASIQEFSSTLATLGQRQEAIMATLQELFDTVSAEKAQVQVKLDALSAQIADLQAQLAAGTVVTAADLDALKAAVEGIFTPDPNP